MIVLATRGYSNVFYLSTNAKALIDFLLLRRCIQGFRHLSTCLPIAAFSWCNACQ